jgi:hypothetical protein
MKMMVEYETIGIATRESYCSLGIRETVRV